MEWAEHATGFSRRTAKRNASFLGVQSTPQCRHPLTKLLPAAVACGALRPNRPFRWWSIGARFQECLSLSLGAGGLGRFGNSRDVKCNRRSQGFRWTVERELLGLKCLSSH